MTLPRVALVDIGKLQPMYSYADVSNTPDADDLKIHEGLLVYNVGDNPTCPTIPRGIYIRDGHLWQSLSGENVGQDMTSFDAITGILTDYEGNQYSTKVLGGKRWMTQNLRSLRKSDGSFIDCPNGLRLNPGLNNGTLNSSIIINDQLPIRSISFKENNITMTVPTKQFVFKFGLAYNLGQALTACARGWHLPTEAEWGRLATFKLHVYHELA